MFYNKYKYIYTLYKTHLFFIYLVLNNVARVGNRGFDFFHRGVVLNARPPPLPKLVFCFIGGKTGGGAVNAIATKTSLSKGGNAVFFFEVKIMRFSRSQNSSGWMSSFNQAFVAIKYLPIVQLVKGGMAQEAKQVSHDSRKSLKQIGTRTTCTTLNVDLLPEFLQNDLSSVLGILNNINNYR